MIGELRHFSRCLWTEFRQILDLPYYHCVTHFLAINILIYISYWLFFWLNHNEHILLFKYITSKIKKVFFNKSNSNHTGESEKDFYNLTGLSLWHQLCFPGGASGKEPACQCRRHKRCGFDPWFRKIPWRRAWQPTPVFLPGESHGQRSLEGFSP